MRLLEDILWDEALRQTDPGAALILTTAAETIEVLRFRCEKQHRELEKLYALQEAGVDNWSGYDEAMKLAGSYEDED